MSVREAELSMLRRVGASEEDVLIVQGNLANTYSKIGRDEEALSMRHEVYSGHLNRNGEEHYDTLREAYNYALSLIDLQRFEEARSLMRKRIPLARRVLGASHEITIRMSRSYARALYNDSDATLDDLREAVTNLEEIAPTARRVLGGAHPEVSHMEASLKNARAKLRAREASSGTG